MRQIILDTETTGIRVDEGHRVIEIGCLEMINRKLTDNRFHSYINPEREIEAGALAVHGISNDFLKDKPTFIHIAQSFVNFIKESELIIHNAPFDLSFLNKELNLVQQGLTPITDYCSIIDTLVIARKLHVGQRNSLDALCKRYGIDNTKRGFHGALLDAHLLAQVYLAMTGGQGSLFDVDKDNTSLIEKKTDPIYTMLKKSYKLNILGADSSEMLSHQQYLEQMKKKGKCLWEE